MRSLSDQAVAMEIDVVTVQHGNLSDGMKIESNDLVVNRDTTGLTVVLNLHLFPKERAAA